MPSRVVVARVPLVLGSSLMLHWLSLLLGPMFAKELVEMARRKRYYLNRVVYAAVLLLTVWIAWEEYSLRVRFGRTAPLRAMAQMAQGIFLAVSIIQYVAVFVFVPLFLSGVIASEREERTLDLLFTTQLSDAEIVLGKLASRMVALLALLLTGLPILSLLTFFGGVDPNQLWQSFACTLLALLFVGAFAIYFSSITKSPMGALIRTYWWLAVFLLGIPMGIGIPLTEICRTPNHPLMQLYFGALYLLHPVSPFVLALEGTLHARLAALLGEWVFALAFVLPSTLACCLIWRAIARLRLAPTPFARLVARLPLAGRMRALWQWAGDFLGEERRQWTARTRLGLPVRNPLWQRARRARIYDREGHISRIQLAGWGAALFFLAVMLAFSANDLDDGGVSMVFGGSAWTGIAVLVAVLAGVSIVGDRRRGFLEQVLVTPLEPREIVDGTLLAVWEHLKRILPLPFLLGTFFVLSGASRPEGVFCSLVTAVLFGLLLVLHGLASSFAARTAPAALVATFLLPLVAIVGITLLIPLCRQAAGPVLWVLSFLCLVGTSLWIRRQVGPASVACYLVSVYLAVGAVATFWTWEGFTRHRHEWPVAAMHPAFLTLVGLDKHFAREFRGHASWVLVYPFYWGALLVNIVWLRWWLIRHFERLVERTDEPIQARLPLLERLFPSLRSRAVQPAADLGVEPIPVEDHARSEVWRRRPARTAGDALGED